MTRAGAMAMLALAGCGFTVTPGASNVDIVDASEPDPDAAVASDGANALCEVPADLAWWRLATATIEADVVGGRLAETLGTVTTVSGPCGPAIELVANTPTSHVRVNDDNAWETLKRIGLWVRTTAQQRTGILSRDSMGFADGTVTLYEAMAMDGVTPLLAVRLQRRSPDTTHVLCGPRPAVGTWAHVEINLGPPNELWIDGVKAVDTTTIVNLFGAVPCGTSNLESTGSPNPFVVGASNDGSTVGTTDNVTLPMVGGAISNLKFFTTRR